MYVMIEHDPHIAEGSNMTQKQKIKLNWDMWKCKRIKP